MESMESKGKHTIVPLINDCVNYPGCASKRGSNYPGFTVFEHNESFHKIKIITDTYF